ncbi:hypothetical protein COEREDRAFT_81573 [Coemansia reversa NRRL 1564]|uniref:DNA-directed RNA polymerase III subunit RPC9 n=1 Tax=Coemansia reversa (strain ATCC 12441 / NRRL 1564) TaxID=763665 RepID=A0A2G5BAV1_COERN|nr:hypothetical protein COEREDRAFT_81573 [Coemansia reversa NRRL 1564]|eukprot:PIA16139.1 hypothetical protein COEREDRAFT_81573 [Coemansia reversa NRRL 1564]
MEVVDRQAALISNYEALLVLREEDERHKESRPRSQTKYSENVTTLMFEALEYLNNTPCSSQSADQIIALKQQLGGLDLTKAEIMQIINHRPKSLVELHLIVEECDERFSVEELERIVETILETLPYGEAENDDGGDQNSDGMVVE